MAESRRCGTEKGDEVMNDSFGAGGYRGPVSCTSNLTLTGVLPGLLKELLWPVFPRRNDIKITLKDNTAIETVNREYADALEWDANRETD